MTDPATTDRQKWDEVVTLAAGLAHEIKNPLGTIDLNLQLLLEDWREPNTPREKRTLKRLRTLQRETARLYGILEDFLRYAKAQSPEPRPCDINETVREILDFVAPQATRQGIEIRTAFAPDLPTINADPKLLKQAILNLVINAEEAMPQGGELIVRTSANGQHVRLDITDTGSGIPDHILPKIFDLYYSTKDGGSGLGLPTTRRIIELHNGSIEVESEVNKGTHFTIRLPIDTTTEEKA